MAALTGNPPKSTYKDLLQVSNANAGIDATLRAVSDGEGTSSPLQLSSSLVNINGAAALELNGTTALAGGLLTHEVGGLEADVSAIADGGILVGDGAGSLAIRAAALTAGAAGFLKHEIGGLEFDASAIADGGVVVGTGTGTMAIRAAMLTAGAAGFLTHEVGGIEANISGVTTDDFLIGTSAGNIGLRQPAAIRTALGLVIGTDVQAWDAQLDDIAALAEAEGNIIVNTGSAWVVKAVGANDTVLTGDDGETGGVKWAALPVALSGSFVSSEQTITAAGSLTIAHSLGAAPTLMAVILKCTDAGGDVGYAQNDELFWGFNGDNQVTTGRGVSVVRDATNLNVRFGNGSSGNCFVVLNKTTGAGAEMDSTKWTAIFMAWV